MTAAMLVQVILGLLSLTGISLGGYATYRGTVRAKVIETEATPYEKLSDRVGMLESQVEDLMTLKWVDRAYIRQLLADWPNHKPLPLPMPEWVATHYGVVPNPEEREE